MIEISLSEGDGWLHRFARNETRLPTTIKTKQPDGTTKYLTEPSGILQHHVAAWSKQWKTEDQELCMETIKVLRNSVQLINGTAATKKCYKPEAIRKAARSFKNGTSTGVDHWTLAEIALMPDQVLRSLGDLLADIQNDSIPPLQALTNIMATLPKKDGGARTVAIATTIYRILMELDNEELEESEKTNAFRNDSAKAGASAAIAAEDRALEAELARADQQDTLTMLYDMKKFFDSLNVAKLFELANDCPFPSKQLVLSMIVHHAPRRLKLGKALSEPIVRMGRSILAGCKRSTPLARVYTLNMVKVLANTHSTFTSLYIHVDDISTLTKASSGKEMVKRATAFACDFAKFARDLKLDISDKTTVVPDNVHTRQFAKNASQLGVPMKVSKEGTDIGVDCSSASKRSTKKQRARAAQTAARAKRTALLAKKTTG